MEKYSTQRIPLLCLRRAYRNTAGQVVRPLTEVDAIEERNSRRGL